MADPAFLFYVNDYLGGTMGFDLTQHGAYLMILLYQFNNGHFKAETAINIIGAEWNRISHKFKTDSLGLYFNEKMDSVINKRKSFKDIQRKNAYKRWDKSGKPLSEKHISSMPVHCDGNAEAMPMDMPNGCMRVGNGNKGGVGGMVSVPKTIYTPLFESFWNEYPKKAGKGKAFINWKKAIKDTEPEIIINGAKRYAEKVRRDGTAQKYVKYPEGWLTGRRWEDEEESTQQYSTDDRLIFPGDEI